MGDKSPERERPKSVNGILIDVEVQWSEKESKVKPKLESKNGNVILIDLEDHGSERESNVIYRIIFIIESQRESERDQGCGTGIKEMVGESIAAIGFDEMVPFGPSPDPCNGFCPCTVHV